MNARESTKDNHYGEWVVQRGKGTMTERGGREKRMNSRESTKDYHYGEWVG